MKTKPMLFFLFFISLSANSQYAVSGEYINMLECCWAINPPLGAHDVSVTTCFKWTAVEDANSYHLQVSDNSLMLNPIIDVSNISEPGFQVSNNKPLPEHHPIFWRVRPCNVNDCGQFCMIFPFITE